MGKRFRVTAIETVVGEGSKFELAENSPDRIRLTSTSAVVQAAMLAAFLVDRAVELETEDDEVTIKRVYAFESGPGQNHQYRGKYRVNRIATQRKSKTGAEYLEAFLVHGNDAELFFKVDDPLLSQLLVAAFAFRDASPGHKLLLYARTQNNTDLIGVRLGEPSPVW